ncbi:hypothetical protein [Leptolyngbya sp. FACHB-17]|uniref:hypothetical protein n=1 Tax=unclassified Leptolyngbya TaxID=2650499 RepID=UPI0016800977|nr:hypothetical protein [Leptolyngbya sp. FACHB-17]MBD2082671.1 hypothetical protein [Leptolyngbya sp. FACHB-17]
MSRKALAFGFIAGLGAAFTLAQPAHAQQAPSSADLLRDPQSQDSLSNLFNNRGENPSTGLMELIQRATQTSIDPDAFRQQQRDSLDAATAEFLKRRQVLLQSQPASVTPAPTTQPVAQPVK